MKITKKDPVQGFTLIELLTVIAVIGILAAIIIPILGRVRESAVDTAVKSQFSQWASAFELFRQEYGYYPDLGDTANDALVNYDANSSNAFYQALHGRVGFGGQPDQRIDEGDPGYEAGNSKGISFYSFSDEEVQTEANRVRIRDSAGNTDIVVLFDRNQSGTIRLSGTDADYTFGVGGLPEVESTRTGAVFSLDEDDFPTTGVRAGVILYSAGAGRSPVLSWR